MREFHLRSIGSRTLSGTVPVMFRPRPVAARRSARSLVDVALDPEQRGAVERAPGGALLVLGEAGHGKTTVALHRVAYLWKSSPAPVHAAVVVPTDGLVRLLQPLLRGLGVDVEVMTYDRWAHARARRAFRGLPRESDWTPPSVMRLKRHPALRLALEELGTRAAGIIDDDPDVPPRRAAANVTRGDLQHLFGDRVLLERVARAGNISQLAVADTLDRTRVQFSLTAEQEWAHVTDRQRLVALDHRAIDEGTASGWANTVDVEDYAVLCELDCLRALRLRRPAAVKRKYDILMIDEAQELAPLELAFLGRTLHQEGTLIVAGDADQHTDETGTFLGWANVMRELGCRGYETVELEIGYRCPPDVVAIARAIRGPASSPMTRAAASVHAFHDETLLQNWLAGALRDLRRLDRRASVAILCRSPLTARRLAAGLHTRELPSRLVFDGRFHPFGAQVSTVSEVKGLEFDYVVVADAGAREYPDDAASRRALYVAVTRARHQVVLVCVGEPSSVLRSGNRSTGDQRIS